MHRWHYAQTTDNIFLRKVHTIYAHRLTDNFMITHLSWWWEDCPWGSHARTATWSWFSADGMSPLRFEPRPLAPKFDWVELGNERAERETWAEKHQGGRIGEPRDGVLMERIDKTTDCRGRQNGRKSSCDTRKFFFPILWKCKQQAWNSSYMIYMQALYSIIFQNIQW